MIYVEFTHIVIYNAAGAIRQLVIVPATTRVATRHTTAISKHPGSSWCREWVTLVHIAHIVIHFPWQKLLHWNESVVAVPIIASSVYHVV